MCVIVSLLLLSISVCAQTISSVRQFSVGQNVTIRGVITNGTELGNIRYIQDATGALPAYGSNLNSVRRGDSIEATGMLYDFNGLLELSPTSSYTNHGKAKVISTPLIIPISSAGESMEAQLVCIENVMFTKTGTFGNSGSNSTVQITDGTNSIDVRINSTTNIDGSIIPSGRVSVIGLLGQYNSKYQLIPRDLNDIFPYLMPNREINVKLNGTTVLNNGTYVLGNNASNSMVIENKGSGVLSIVGASFSGTNSTEFSTTLNACELESLTSSSFILKFNPSGIGTRIATLSITSDDSDENPYRIKLIAVGTDGLATSPSTNPSNLTFPKIEAYTLSGQYSAGTNAQNYLVLLKIGSPITAVPADGSTYRRGDWLGDAKVAYVGSGTFFTPRGIFANQNYYFKIFAFNGPEGFENYLTTNPATGSVVSLGSQIGTYYKSIKASSTNLLSQLTDLINNHTFVSYFNFKQTMMNQFEVKDTTAGKSYVTCVYTGEKKVFTDPFEWTSLGYSREHTYSHSWMPTYPCDSPEKPEYTDQHNLFPTNFQKANKPRSNLAFMDITGDTVYSYLGGNVGYNGSQLVYEPRDEQKGNIARAIFYMATCYNGVLGNNWHIPPTKDYPDIIQNEESLKNWHFNDLPDNYEIARHEYIYSLQGNRNPFIDSIQFVCNIQFSDMSYVADDYSLGLEEKLDANLVVFPVPTSDKIFIQVNGTEIRSWNLMDMKGIVVDSDTNIHLPLLTLEASSLSAGTYIIKVETPFGYAQRQFIIQ
jgi:endonuclease I